MQLVFLGLVAVSMSTVLVAKARAQNPVAPPNAELKLPFLPQQADAVFAQPANGARVLPAAAASTVLNFSNLVAAKINLDKDPAQIIFMVESYRPEAREIDVMRPVARNVTQTYTNSNGERAEREVSITEFVPEKIKQTVLIPAGQKPQTLHLADFDFYDLDAQQVPPAEAAKRLQMLQPVFLFEGFVGGLKPLGKFERQVLKPEVLMVTTEKLVRSHPQPQWRPVGVADFAIPRPAMVPAIGAEAMGVGPVTVIKPSSDQFQPPETAAPD